MFAVVEQDTAHRLATLRLVTPSGSERGVVVDLLFASSGIEPEVVAEAEQLELLANLELPVARLEHLVALKVLSREDARRPQDRLDLFALVRTASTTQLEAARTALGLIERRGFNRARDLLRSFDETLAEALP